MRGTVAHLTLACRWLICCSVTSLVPTQGSGVTPSVRPGLLNRRAASGCVGPRRAASGRGLTETEPLRQATLDTAFLHFYSIHLQLAYRRFQNQTSRRQMHGKQRIIWNGMGRGLI
jgi:hypothetical protein